MARQIEISTTDSNGMEFSYKPTPEGLKLYAELVIDESLYVYLTREEFADLTNQVTALLMEKANG